DSGDYIKCQCEEKKFRDGLRGKDLNTSSAIAADEKIDGHGDSHHDDEALDPDLRKLLREVRAGVAAEQGARGHDDGLRPDDRARHNESDCGNAVDDAAQDYFELVHGVNVGHAERGEHSEIHDSDATAEIAAVN